MLLSKDRIAIPYMACDHPHKYPRWPGVITGKTGWATWTRGRLCALRADEEGQFNTFSLKVTGDTLRVNCKVHRAGIVRVGLSDGNGCSAAECDPITGDHLEHTVTWKGNPHHKIRPGNETTLRFEMRAAELFGFEWA